LKVFSEVLGREVEVPDAPERIVSLAPAITETLYLLGLEERIVGVSHFCNKPERAKTKPRLGSYFKVNYKKLEELKPDLILVTTGAQRRLALELSDKGYPVYPVPLPVSLYGILDNIIIIGHVTGTTLKARRLARSVAEKLDNVKGALRGLKVYYEIWLGGSVSAGRFSYISDALYHVGFDNCFEDTSDPWIIEPDPEKIAACDPDIILYEVPPYSEALLKQIARSLLDRGLLRLRAVQERGVLLLPPDSLAHYGPSIAETLEDIVLSVKGRRPIYSSLRWISPQELASLA
jgi:iron complex transport system substrate-binding protein